MSDEKKQEGISGKPIEVKREGNQIVIPEGVSYAQARDWITRQEQEENTQVRVWEEFDGHPLDAMLAVQKALNEEFGWTNLTSTPGFFGPTPPSMVTVKTGVDTTVQVPWGRMQLAGIEGYFEPTTFVNDDGRMVPAITGVTKKRHVAQISRVMARARVLLRTESIYKGRAIRIKLLDKHGDPAPNANPHFLDTSKTKPAELVFGRAVQEQVEVSLYTPVEHSQACREQGIPLKRGVLLSGEFGVGKSLAATVMAKKCEENGWTFILLEDTSELAEVVKFAKAYEPAVIFAEDIDRVLDGDRSLEMDEILNIIDGVESKARELMIVLTTNDVGAINPAMLRAGRIDALINVTPPDAEAAVRLVQLYARGQLAPGVDLSRVGDKLAGHKPASIREVVERAKLAALRAKRGASALTADDLLVAADTMAPHFALMSPKIKVEETSLGDVMSATMTSAVTSAIKAASKNGLRDTIADAVNAALDER